MYLLDNNLKTEIIEFDKELLNHSTSGSFECPVCIWTFKTNEFLNIHIQMMHVGDGVTVKQNSIEYICFDCSFCSSDQLNMDLHYEQEHENM